MKRGYNEMEEGRHFYLALPSDEGGAEFNATNTNVSYKIRLPHPIRLKDDEEWEVALASVAVPLVDHQEHMLSHFWRNTAVAKMGARVFYKTSDGSVSNVNVVGQVTIEDIVDPDVPLKGGRAFMENLTYALDKALQAAAVKGMSSFFSPAAIEARFGSFDEPNSSQNDKQSKQRFSWTKNGALRIEGTSTVLGSIAMYVAFESRLAEFMGLVKPGTVGNPSGTVAQVGRRLYYEVSPTLTVPHQLNRYWSLESATTNGVTTRWIRLENDVDWFIYGLDDGWYESKAARVDRVLYVSSNISDRSVVGGRHTDVLGVAKINTTQDGQTYYEPTHLRYLPVRQHYLDIVEIRLMDFEDVRKEGFVNLGLGTTTVVLHFRPAIKGSDNHDTSHVKVH